jgi:DNA topoisomerase-1
VRDEAKYERLVHFGKALPAIRAAVSRDLARRGLPRERVVAAVVRLLEVTHARVGNVEYARENHSYGLTTLEDRHLGRKGAHLVLRFRGKSGKLHEVEIDDRRVRRVVARCSELPGHELFQYVEAGGQPVTIESTDVNEYVRRAGGAEFTAKDFRTWSGTVLAARDLCRQPGCATKQRIRRVVEAVAQQLGNTPAVCRRCYLHPAVLEASLDGRLGAAMRGRDEERAVIALLERKARATHRRGCPEWASTYVR